MLYYRAFCFTVGGIPPAYMAVLVMEDLPADEKIIYEGSVYSTENPEPDLSDCVFINDYSNYEPFLN